MARITRIQSFQQMLLWFCLCQPFTAVVADGESANQAFTVRSLVNNAIEKRQEERRAFFDITFSDEGVPLELQPIAIKLIPTPGDLDDDSLQAIERSMEDYLLDTLTSQWSGNEDGTGGGDQIEISDVSVVVTDSQAVSSRRLFGRRQLQTTGTLVEMVPTVTFSEQPLPSDSDVQSAMDTSLSDLDTYIQNYLLPEGASELQSLETAEQTTLDVSPSPTTSPTSAPTSSPTENSGGLISQINQSIPINADGDRSLQKVWPAVICGVAVFIMTVIFLGHRRNRVSGIAADVNESYDSYDTREVSVMDASRAIEVRPSQGKSFGAYPRDDLNHLQSVPMEDGQTCIHIPPVTDSASRVYDSSPMVIRTASSVGSSFDERDQTSTMLGLGVTSAMTPISYDNYDELNYGE